MKDRLLWAVTGSATIMSFVSNMVYAMQYLHEKSTAGVLYGFEYNTDYIGLNLNTTILRINTKAFPYTHTKLKKKEKKVRS